MSLILSAVRTPIGKFLGSLSSFTAPQLGAIPIRALANGKIDQVVMGEVLQAGVGQHPARQWLC